MKRIEVVMVLLLFLLSVGCRSQQPAPPPGTKAEVVNNLMQKKDAPKQDVHEANSQDSWSYEEPIDKITGGKTYQATRTVALDIGGTAKMTADCRGGEDSSRNLGIRIVFFDKEGKGIDVDPVEFKNNVGSFRFSESQGQAGTIEVLLLHSNEILIVGISTFDSSGGDAMYDKQDARLFANAQFAKIEIPLLVEGEKPVIDLKPQDPALRNESAGAILGHITSRERRDAAEEK